VEFHLHPEKLDSWGGPFNGQCFRQTIYVDLVRACGFAAIVETGTFRGSTSIFLAQNSAGAPVFSSEISTRYFEIAKRRLRAIPNLHLLNLDSRLFLSTLKLPPQTKTFFYLDAHWREDLPLAAEIEIINLNFSSFVVMVDDFQVPNDAGYAFDDYGPGKSLSLRDFSFLSDRRFFSYLPARSSDQESGLRRGCIVLVSPDLKETVDSTGCLQRLTPDNLRG